MECRTKFEHANRYPAGSADVLAMLTDRAFRDPVCQEQRALSHRVTIMASGSGASMEIRQEQSIAGAPSIATQIVGSPVEIVQRETWRFAESRASSQVLGGPVRRGSQLAVELADTQGG